MLLDIFSELPAIIEGLNSVVLLQWPDQTTMRQEKKETGIKPALTFIIYWFAYEFEALESDKRKQFMKLTKPWDDGWLILCCILSLC